MGFFIGLVRARSLGVARRYHNVIGSWSGSVAVDFADSSKGP